MAEFNISQHTLKNVNRVSCAACLELRSRSGATVTRQECDMLLLPVPGEHVALVSDVWDCVVVKCGAIPPPAPVRKSRLYWASLEPHARYTCEDAPKRIPFYIAQAPIFCLHLKLLITLRSTRAPYRSQAGPPSNCGVAVSADVAHDEYERHRAFPSFKTPNDQPSYVPLHTHTLRGADLSN